jgi:hypothetical protein
MRPWLISFLAVTVFLLGVPMTAPAQQAASENSDEITQRLEKQDQTIRRLEERINELEGGAASSRPLPEAGPVPPVTKPGEAPSPAEEAEAVLYGHKDPVEYRGAFTDRQQAAARPADYTFDPEYRGFIPIPNTVLMIKLNARPRLDMIMSSTDPGSDFRFVPALFPVEGQPGYDTGSRFNASANGTQLRLDMQAPSVPGGFRFFYQNDFFGSDTRNMQYRLQHLYGEYYGVVAGFTYGVFEDPDAWPDTLDYEGPNSVIFARRPLVQYKTRLSDNWQFTLALEDPDIYVDTTGDPDARQRTRAPDGGFNFRWTPGELGHVQFSTIFRSIGIDGVTVPSNDVFGWGVNLAGALEVTSRDTIVFWFVTGDGVGGMGNDTSFLNSDAALDADGELEALRYYSTMIALTHNWTPRWRSTATHGYVNLENTAMQDPNAYHLSHYASLNLIYKVLKRLSVGIEGLYGYKKVKSDSSNDVFRVQVSIAYSIFD